MTGSFFVALAAAMVCTALVLILRQLLFSPVRSGKNSELLIVLRIFGRETTIDYTLCSLVWLSQNDVMNARIIILGYDLDDETRYIAESYERKYKNITLIQDGEISQWIKNLS